jgi:hypothetical protein
VSDDIACLFHVYLATVHEQPPEVLVKPCRRSIGASSAIPDRLRFNLI